MPGRNLEVRLVARLLPVIVLAVALAAAPAARGADDETEEAARKLYVSAFEEEDLKLKERVEIWEKLVKEYPEAKWADDALWVLGELAERTRHPKRAMDYRLELVKRRPLPLLEDYTKKLSLYRRSRVAQVVRLLRATASFYQRRGHSVRVFNPLPLAVHEQLARAYTKSQDYEQAIRHYRKAISYSPEGAVTRRFFARTVAGLEKRQRRKELLRKQRAAAEDAEEVAPSEGKGAEKVAPSAAEKGSRTTDDTKPDEDGDAASEKDEKATGDEGSRED